MKYLKPNALLFCVSGLLVSVLANAALGYQVLKNQQRNNALDVFVKKDVPEWLKTDDAEINQCERLNTYARTTAMLYMSLYCDDLSGASCDAKAQGDASRLGGKTWERYSEKQKMDVSLHNGGLP